MGASSSSLIKELWVGDVMQYISKANNFTGRMVNDSSFIKNGYVNLPQGYAGVSTISMDASASASYQTGKLRTDAITQYQVHSFSLSQPVVVSDIEQQFISYDKRQSIIGQDTAKLIDTAYDYILYSIASDTTSANVVLTTGTGRTAIGPTQTGSRKSLTADDIFKAAAKMDYANIPSNGRMLIVSPAIAYDLKKMSVLTLGVTPYDPSFSSRVMNGYIGTFQGFEVFERNTTITSTVSASTWSSINLWNNATTGQSALNCETAIAFHPSFTRYAMGDYKLFVNEDDPHLLGSSLNMICWAAGKASYADARGIVLISEDISY
jgi:hypothetical protein